MEEYKRKLYEELDRLAEGPVSMRSVEEAEAIIGLMCALDRVAKRSAFTQRDAEEWTARMQNEDGTYGAHWTQAETQQVAEAAGIHTEPAVWFAALNMIYSDYSGVARKYGLDHTEFYTDLAKAFLFDKDAGGPERKTAAYYRCVAGGE